MDPKAKSFVICEVEFEDKITRSISCSSWIIKLDHREGEKPQTYILWPRNKEMASLYAKSDSIPGKDWVPYKCKILAECNDYEVARLRLIHLNETGFSGGTKAKVSKPNVLKSVVSKPVVSKPVISKPVVSKPVASSENVSRDTDGARCLEPNEPYRSSDMSSYVTEYLLHENKKLKARQQAKDLVDNIIKMNRLNMNDMEESDHKRDYYNFPLKTVGDVDEMEGKLKLTSLNHLIIKSHLWKSGPLSNVNDTVPYMLQRLISDECAKNYEYDENSNSKLVFKNLIMCSIVVDVAMSYHENSSMEDIENQIRNWLTVAEMRCKNMKMLRKKYNV